MIYDKEDSFVYAKEHMNIKNIWKDSKYKKSREILSHLVIANRKYNPNEFSLLRIDEMMIYEHNYPLSSSVIELKQLCAANQEIIDFMYLPVDDINKDISARVGFLINNNLLNPEFIKFLTVRLQDNYGYYLVRGTVFDEGLLLEYEPYSIPSDLLPELPNTLIRVVKAKRRDEVLLNGFKVKGRDGDIKWPPRVYLFFPPSDFNKFCREIVPTLYDTNDYENPKGENEMCVFSVDTTKLMNHEFYIDRRYDDNCISVWTYDDIPVEAINKHPKIIKI